MFSQPSINSTKKICTLIWRFNNTHIRKIHKMYYFLDGYFQLTIAFSLSEGLLIGFQLLQNLKTCCAKLQSGTQFVFIFLDI